MTRYESCVGARIILILKRPNPELGRLFFPAYFRSYDIKFSAWLELIKRWDQELFIKR